MWAVPQQCRGSVVPEAQGNSFPRRHYTAVRAITLLLVGRFSLEGHAPGTLVDAVIRYFTVPCPPLPTTTLSLYLPPARRRHPAAAYLSLKYPLRRRCPPPSPPASRDFPFSPGGPCTSACISHLHL